MKLDALVFDAYGTLFDVHSVVHRCETCWPGKGVLLSATWRARQLEYTWQRSLMQRYAPFSQVTREALEYACAALALPLDDAGRRSLMEEYLCLSLYPEVKGAMEGFRGLKLALLTNGSLDMIDPLVKNSGLEFDAVLSVDEVKIFKPAPQVYELALRRLGIAADGIGFVSSNCWDALGAKSFGLRVYWINRLGAPADRLGFQLDSVIESLAGIRA